MPACFTNFPVSAASPAEAIEIAKKLAEANGASLIEVEGENGQSRFVALQGGAWEAFEPTWPIPR